MLKQRIATAAVLIPLVFLSIIYLNNTLFQWLIYGVVLVAAIEWFGIIGLKQYKSLILAFAALLAMTLLTNILVMNQLMVIVAVVWILITINTLRYAHIELSTAIFNSLSTPWFAVLLSVLVLSLFANSAVLLHGSSNLGPQQLLYAMVLVWLADTGGYFAGKRYGKTPLAKAISPNKTWEGVVGAVVLGSMWALLAYMIGVAGDNSIVLWLFISAVTLLVSIIGDLFESVFKRINNVKDSGTLLPGHGGMLDRIDSLLAAIPVFTALLYFLGV